MKKISVLLLLVMVLIGCDDQAVPKPQGFLRLEYPIAKYETFRQDDCPFSFGKNIYGIIKSKKDCNFNIEYPKMRASIYITYKQVNNDLNSLLSDAQHLTYTHAKKAQTIIEQPFVNKEDRVFGMFYDVGGDAASATQFYLTDSLNHFVLGSVYFKVKPNSDSLLPASEYIKKDVRLLIESFKWKK